MYPEKLIAFQICWVSKMRGENAGGLYRLEIGGNKQVINIIM